MSYDLMVFEPSAAPRARNDFMDWFDQQTQWAEPHGYNDPNVTSPPLRAWFLEMIESFPAMNGPYAADDIDDSKVTDYCIGKQVIYAAFAWSQAESAFLTMATLANKHGVGLYDVSSSEGAILFPGEFEYHD